MNIFLFVLCKMVTVATVLYILKYLGCKLDLCLLTGQPGLDNKDFRQTSRYMPLHASCGYLYFKCEELFGMDDQCIRIFRILFVF